MTRTSTLRPELSDAYFAWFDAPERERDEKRIADLESIRRDEGPLWAIYASAFYSGAAVRRWRIELIEKLEAMLS